MFTINYHGIDGSESHSFKSLSSVARYVRARDLGPEYRRSWGLQDEYAQLIFGGFGWSDLLINGEYRADLLNAPRKITWRKRIVTSSYGDRNQCWDGWEDGQKLGTVVLYQNQPGHYMVFSPHLTIGSAPTLAEGKSMLLSYLENK